MGSLPREAEFVVIGGGTSGSVVAARLIEAGHRVLILEAGPDFGAFGDPRWPADFLDATRLGRSHDWGYDSGDTLPERVSFERTRAIGGCSDVNGTTQTWGHRRDYDGWAEAGNPGWAMDELLPLFAAATERMRVVAYQAEELTPWQRAWYDAAPEAGIPQRASLNNVDEGPAVAPEENNIVEGVRFNTAFAYLDPNRHDPQLTIVGNAHVARVLVEHGTAVGVEVQWQGETHVVRAGHVVVAGGAFNSPQILQRSGIGAPRLLAAHGIPLVSALDGVGENLHDQPFSLMSWAGSDRMTRQMEQLRSAGWAPDEQLMGKAASSFDPTVFDLHFLPYSPTHRGETRRWSVGVANLQPVSRGFVRISGIDPEAKPVIDHRFLSDPERRDATVLAEGMQLMRDMAASDGLRALVGEELNPSLRAAADHGSLVAHVEANPDNYWHPVGTCKMGPADDPTAVVDSHGAVHGVAGLSVADCSIMPRVPRATTAMPAVVIGERIARFLLTDRA
ncbi:MAG: family oxidoreductase [Glaciihabitans sp.]|nr:family oxidoreductase [Glaciihabitans sp.]